MKWGFFAFCRGSWQGALCPQILTLPVDCTARHLNSISTWFSGNAPHAVSIPGVTVKYSTHRLPQGHSSWRGGGSTWPWASLANFRLLRFAKILILVARHSSHLASSWLSIEDLELTLKLKFLKFFYSTVFAFAMNRECEAFWFVWTEACIECCPSLSKSIFLALYMVGCLFFLRCVGSQSLFWLHMNWLKSVCWYHMLCRVMSKSTEAQGGQNYNGVHG